MAERVQLKRTKGWRMPRGAVKVDRTSKWGNPYKVVDSSFPTRPFQVDHTGTHGTLGSFRTEDEATSTAVKAFRRDLLNGTLDLDVTELAGKTLACWCELGSPCHADVLLELANEPPQ